MCPSLGQALHSGEPFGLSFPFFLFQPRRSNTVYSLAIANALASPSWVSWVNLPPLCLSSFPFPSRLARLVVQVFGILHNVVVRRGPRHVLGKEWESPHPFSHRHGAPQRRLAFVQRRAMYPSHAMRACVYLSNTPAVLLFINKLTGMPGSVATRPGPPLLAGTRDMRSSMLQHRPYDIRYIVLGHIP